MHMLSIQRLECSYTAVSFNSKFEFWKVSNVGRPNIFVTWFRASLKYFSKTKISRHEHLNFSIVQWSARSRSYASCSYEQIPLRRKWEFRMAKISKNVDVLVVVYNFNCEKLHNKANPHNNSRAHAEYLKLDQVDNECRNTEFQNEKSKRFC